MVGNIEYTVAGALLANGWLTGNVNFNNRGGTFYLGDDTKIIGSVTSTAV
ncbi:hypothetical protein [Candidatus Rickettsia kedanie]|uniref:Uncharacterized protein n=1 Tax=Candidatus Rickettsia kedanie TaxID=3115352 RepID=A0ABP9TU95_9RICK